MHRMPSGWRWRLRPWISSTAVCERLPRCSMPGSTISIRRNDRRRDALEGRLQSGLERARTRGAERFRVRKLIAAIGEIRNRGRIEEGAVGRIAVVEEIIDAAIDLIRLVDLVGSVKAKDRIGRQLRRLVGFVSDQILTAHQ